MNWFSNLIDRWSIRIQKKELTEFIDKLSSLDSSEIGPIVAMATHTRHALEGLGHNVMDPMLYAVQNPGFSIALHRSIVDFQKMNQPQKATGLMIWLHTSRASLHPELRALGRQMWRQLSRGFLHADESAFCRYIVTGETLNTKDSAQFPRGFTPEPQ